jgi:sirohydrochlorin cobaltochelatase
MNSSPGRALVFFAHGSSDPDWKLPVEHIARHAAAIEPDLFVRCAYLDITEPGMIQVAQELYALGVRQMSVVPLFLGIGRHVREDMPRLLELLRATLPGLAITAQNALGENNDFLRSIAQLSVARERTP